MMLSLRQTALFSKGARRRTAAIKRQDGIFTFSSRLASSSASGRAAAREAHVSSGSRRRSIRLLAKAHSPLPQNQETQRTEQFLEG